MQIEQKDCKKVAESLRALVKSLKPTLLSRLCQNRHSEKLGTTKIGTTKIGTTKNSYDSLNAAIAS